MRSAVQSCVPLQESTAKCCVFCLYTRQATPRRGRALAFRAQRKMAQRKIPVVLSFPYHRHKAGIASGKQMVRWTFAASGSPLGVARAACFEQLAGVFASCGALHYAKDLFKPEEMVLRSKYPPYF